MNNNNILVLPDLHLGRIGYSDNIEDGREGEKKEILDFIIAKAKDCDKVVFLGDIFQTRNPLSSTVREFTEFLEKFGDKQIFIIAGNHDQKADGTTALDYIKEISGKNWNVITSGFKKIDDLVFLSYTTKNKLEEETNESATKKLVDSLPIGNILFHHQAMKGSTTVSGQLVDLFDEIVLPYKELLLKFKYIFGGHIHKPSVLSSTDYGKGSTYNVVVGGSTMNNEVGEMGKSIWKFNDGIIEDIQLPGRKVMGEKNPTISSLSQLNKHNIIKATITKEYSSEDIKILKDKLKEFDAHLLVIDIPKERKKIELSNHKNISSLSIPELLEIFGKERKIDINRINKGFELIRQ